MNSLVLSVASRVLKPPLLVISILVLLRGHDEPGGGFAGGLLAAAAFTFQALAAGTERVRRSIRVPMHTLIGAGLALALASAALPLALGEPILTSQHGKLPFPPGWSAGTTLMFDAGIYLIVLGTMLLIVLELSEEES